MFIGKPHILAIASRTHKSPKEDMSGVCFSAEKKENDKSKSKDTPNRVLKLRFCKN